MSKETTAILVHTCGIDDERPSTPDTVARQSALAAAEQLRKDPENTYLVITAGEYNHEGPDLGKNLADHIKKLLAGSDSHILTTHSARTTVEEVRDFQKLAAEKGWTNLYDLGPKSQHNRRQKAIDSLMKGLVPDDHILDAEQVLIGENPERYMNAVNLVAESPKYQSYERTNKQLDRINKLPFGIGEQVISILGKVMSNRLKSKVSKKFEK